MNASGEALSMEASREFSCAPPHLPPCREVQVLQRTRMSHFWNTLHSSPFQRWQSAFVSSGI